MFRLIQELRPSFVIGENVSGHIKLGLDTVLENLESESYTARTFSISAASIGANHKRERVWTLAYSNDKGIRARFGRSNYDYEKKGRGWSFDRGRSESDDEWSDSSTTKTEALDVADSSGKGGREPGHFDKEKRNTESSATQSQSSSSDVADTNSKRRRLWETGSEDAEDVGQSSRGQETLGWWDVEPDVGRVGHGIPQRVDRLKGLGNAVVPQIPFLIGLTIREMIENE
jgi:DNA (cytosine-5)-methyltransferase 1